MGSDSIIGSSTSFSIISPSGMKWIADVTGNDDFEKVVSKLPNMNEVAAVTDPKIWAHVPEEELTPMPSEGRANAYLNGKYTNLYRLICC